MKEKFLNLLRAKFVGTHSLVLDRVADHLSQTVTDEAQIETAIAGVEPLVKSFSEVLQSETDRRVTDVQKKADEAFRKKYNLDENGKLIQVPQTSPTPTPVGTDEMPAWAKSMMDTVTKFSGTVESLAKKNSQTEKLSIAKGKLKSKGVLDKHLDSFAGRINLEAEDFDSEVERISQEYTGFRQDFINTEVEKGNYTPVAGGESEDSMVKNLENWGKKFESKTN